MLKSEFLALFANGSHAIRIRMALNYDAFLENETIEITEEVVSLCDVLDFYVPKYEKHSTFDRSHYDLQALDPEILPLTVKQVMGDPVKWDLAKPAAERPSIDQFSALPIATDLKSNRTLILDSNHTLVSTLNELDRTQFNTISLPVVRIVGTGLENFIPDFRILNRKSS